MFHSEAAVSQELKIVYLNINGLLHANHSEDMGSDYNFEEADLICVAESKASEHISSNRLAISGFTFLGRLDFAAHAFGLVLYKKMVILISHRTKFVVIRIRIFEL